MGRSQLPDKSNGLDYHSMMKLYIYGTNNSPQIDNSRMEIIKGLVEQSLNTEQLEPEITELSVKQSPHVWEFGRRLGMADTNAALFSRILEAQDRSRSIVPDFQHGYIAGMFKNDVEKAIAKIHDAVTGKGQKLYSFSWNGLGVIIRDVSEGMLEKLVNALLMCDSQSRRTALQLCKRYYDGRDLSTPRFVRDMLLSVHSDVFSSPQEVEFEQWKNLLIKYVQEHSTDTNLISESLQIALKHFPKHFADGGWHSILSAMLKQNKERTWKSILQLVGKQRDMAKIRFLLQRLDGVLSDDVALAVICDWVDVDQKHRASLIAWVLPSNLDTMTKWISLYHVKNKSEIALRLLDNILTDSVVGTREEHYRLKIREVEDAKRDNDNTADVLSWLKGYEAVLLSALAAVLMYEMCDAFGVGKTESEEERACRDLLRCWLKEHMGIKNMGTFLQKFDSEKEGERRQDGNVWHAELIRLFCENGTFVVAGVECKIESRENIDIDIKLIDRDNPGEEVNIQAWYGMSETGHKIRRLLHTGTVPDLSGFNWDSEHEVLKDKIDQLPELGQNFVIHGAPSMSLAHVASHDLLTEHVCVLQVYDTHVNVYYRSSFKYKTTARKIANMLRPQMVILEDGWANEPGGISSLSAATYGFDPLEPHGN